MKMDKASKALKDVFGFESTHSLNKTVKAVAMNFGDERGVIVVKNDNYGTDRRYMDFTEGKKAAGLNPMQIVFTSLEMARISHDKFIGADDKMHLFEELPLTMTEIRKKSGLSRIDFAKKYEIPVRTLENWESGKSIPPNYVMNLLRESVERGE